MREVQCPSGAILKINSAPFKEARSLYKAVLKEARGVNLSTQQEMGMLLKELFCAAFSSEEVEAPLWDCLRRCLYKVGNVELKIDDNTFEPVAARDDYMVVCMEVAKENILPFVKSLYAEFQKALATIAAIPA